MAVVINDFEVMPGEPRQQRSGGPEEKGSEEQSPPDDHEIERLVEHQLRRCERVWAH